MMIFSVAKVKAWLAKYLIRILLLSALATSLFVGGCMYSDKQHAEHAADVERAKALAIADREKELNAEWREKLKIEEDARVALQFDLSVIEDREDELLNRIRNLRLTKPADQANIESCVETDDENVQIVIANPFGPEFVSVWNDASRAVRTGE